MNPDHSIKMIMVLYFIQLFIKNDKSNIQWSKIFFHHREEDTTSTKSSSTMLRALAGLEVGVGDEGNGLVVEAGVVAEVQGVGDQEAGEVQKEMDPEEELEMLEWKLTKMNC